MAGLASMFLGQENPLAQWIEPRRNSLLGLGSDLLSGNIGGGGVMAGKQMDDANAIRAQEEEARQARMTQAAAAARQSGNEQLAQLFESGMGMGDAIGLNNALNPQAGGDGAPANVREWEYYNGLSPEDQIRYREMKRASQYLNTKTDFVNPDNGVSIPINNQQAASDTAFGTAVGKEEGAAAALASSWESKLPGLKQVVDELGVLADTATYTAGGQLWDEAVKQLGLPPSEAAVARTKYIAMVDNQVLPLLRDTFGAAFTVQEGESLRATLGDPNKSPQEKKAVLEAFIEQKYRDLEALQSRTGGGQPTGGVDDILSEYGL